MRVGMSLLLTPQMIPLWLRKGVKSKKDCTRSFLRHGDMTHTLFKFNDDFVPTVYTPFVYNKNQTPKIRLFSASGTRFIIPVANACVPCYNLFLHPGS